MNFHSRLKQIRKQKSLTQKDFADIFGVRQKTVSNWERGRNEPSVEVFNIIRTKWAININWLLSGNGAMFEADITDTAVKEQSAKYDSSELEIVQIQQHDISLPAGAGAYPSEHTLSIGSRSFDKQWLDSKGLNIAQLSLHRVTGDSMEPLLKDKDIVMIDASRIKPTEGMPFVLRLDGDLLVKNIQRTGDGFWSLISRNKAYDNIVINPKEPPDDFAIIGAVVWHEHCWI